MKKKIKKAVKKTKKRAVKKQVKVVKASVFKAGDQVRVNYNSFWNGEGTIGIIWGTSDQGASITMQSGQAKGLDGTFDFDNLELLSEGKETLTFEVPRHLVETLRKAVKEALGETA